MIDILEYQDNLFSQITQFYRTDMCLLLCVLQVSCNILIFAKYRSDKWLYYRTIRLVAYNFRKVWIISLN